MEEGIEAVNGNGKNKFNLIFKKIGREPEWPADQIMVHQFLILKLQFLDCIMEGTTQTYISSLNAGILYFAKICYHLGVFKIYAASDNFVFGLLNTALS